ncbi:MAG: TetR/AcrR family transcriptional regulator [Candidatus Melainabacteria bacterium]|nr:TetR/AcrR family transcriptional regulator [Candidatus Melainabacteria bacterium]
MSIIDTISRRADNITNVRYKNCHHAILICSTAPSRAPVMPKIIDHDEYRKELLCKSFECFAAKGYGQVTMRALAEHVGVSTGTLYHYFSSKEALFEQLVAFQADSDLMLAARLPDSENLQQRVHMLLKLLMENREYVFKQVCVWLDFGRQHGFDTLFKKEVVRQSYERYMRFLSQYLGISDKSSADFVCSYLTGLVSDPYIMQQKISVKKHSQLVAKAIADYSKYK